MKMFRKDEGFTLVELMVVVLIIGILVAIAIPVFNAAKANAQRKSCFANQRTIEGSAQTYNAENDASAGRRRRLWSRRSSRSPRSARSRSWATRSTPAVRSPATAEHPLAGPLSAAPRTRTSRPFISEFTSEAGGTPPASLLCRARRRETRRLKRYTVSLTHDLWEVPLEAAVLHPACAVRTAVRIVRQRRDMAVPPRGVALAPRLALSRLRDADRLVRQHARSCLGSCSVAACRSCGTAIPVRYPVVELLSAVLWVLAGVLFGMSLQTAAAVFFFYLLLILSFIDLDLRRLPNGLVGLLFAVGLLGVLVSQFTRFEVLPLLPGGHGVWGAADRRRRDRGARVCRE